MTTTLSVIGVSALLILEGRSLVVLIQKKKSHIAWGLGYPVGALLNAFLFFILHLLGISFGIASVFGAHLLLTCLLVGASNSLPLAKQTPHTLYEVFVIVSGHSSARALQDQRDQRRRGRYQ